MFASFVATGLSAGALLILPVLMAVGALKSKKDIDYLDPRNCRNQDV